MDRHSHYTIYSSIFLVSMATLAWEISLTRIFAITQFYHFAFLAINVALLGFGASGTVLALRPQWTQVSESGSYRSALAKRLEVICLIFSISLLGSYFIINSLPFDSYAVAWDKRQIWLLIMYYLVLALPFFCTGLAVSIALAMTQAQSNRIYSANLLGSATGALAVPLILPWLGIPGIIFATAATGLLGAAVTRLSGRGGAVTNGPIRYATIVVYALLLFSLVLFIPVSPSFAELRLSPYKGLSQALNYPEATVVTQEDGYIARTEIIESAGVRSLPGLSFMYSGTLPPQFGLFSDSDDLSPVIDSRQRIDWSFLSYLPEALAYALRPNGDALVLNPRGGLALWQALGDTNSDRAVIAVEPDPLVSAQVDDLLGEASPYRHPQVTAVTETARSFLERTDQTFDIIQLPLNQPFRPVTSGAYSLGETYDLSLESMDTYLDHLSTVGILVITRWLQTPPSESLRALALVVEGLRGQGVADVEALVVALRGVQTATLMIKRVPWTAEELAQVRAFARDRRFDLAFAPDLTPDEANQFNITPEPYYEQAYHNLIYSDDLRAFYDEQPFEISPPTDDQPFFYHFFKWSQTPAVLRTLGQTWQPFGGSGILVLVALLILAVLSSVFLILAPLVLQRVFAIARDKEMNGETGKKVKHFQVLLYFGALGLGFMLVEIPLVQRFILFLGHPTLALAVVLAGILFWSGLGSLLSTRFSWRLTLLALLAVLILYVATLNSVFQAFLGAAPGIRLLVAWLLLMPPGLLMGMPFPNGLRWLSSTTSGLIPWAWAINGCASVVGSVLAALLALQWGFNLVLWVGIACYLVVTTIAWISEDASTNHPPVLHLPEAQNAHHPYYKP